MVGAQVAGDGSGGMGEGRQRLLAEQGAPLQVEIPGGQSGAESAHQSGDGGARHVSAQLLLKSAQYGVVEEGAPLDHDVPAQVVGRGGPNDLVDGVFHDGDGETGRDILHAGPVLLGLLDRRVHKHGAAGAQIHRMGREEPQLGEIGDVVPQSLGEGLDKRAASGGAGLIEHDGVHGPIADLEALHVLAANVDDEVDVRIEMGGGVVVRHRLHQP